MTLDLALILFLPAIPVVMGLATGAQWLWAWRKRRRRGLRVKSTPFANNRGIQRPK